MKPKHLSGALLISLAIWAVLVFGVVSLAQSAEILRRDPNVGINDLISGATGAFTRDTSTGPKTVLVPSTGLITTVTKDTAGYEAFATSGRYGVRRDGLRENGVANGIFVGDSNTDGLADNWLIATSASAENPDTMSLTNVTASFPVAAVVNAQRIAGTEGTAAGTGVVNVVSSSYQTGVAVGDKVTVNVYLKGSVSGCTIYLKLYEYDSGSTSLTSQLGSGLSITSSYVRYTQVFTVSHANTAKVRAALSINGLGSGDTYDIYFTLFQSSKSLYATSFIPTSGTSLTRESEESDPSYTVASITGLSSALGSAVTILKRFQSVPAYSTLAAGTYKLESIDDNAGLLYLYHDGTNMHLRSQDQSGNTATVQLNFAAATEYRLAVRAGDGTFQVGYAAETAPTTWTWGTSQTWAGFASGTTLYTGRGNEESYLDGLTVYHNSKLSTAVIAAGTDHIFGSVYWLSASGSGTGAGSIADPWTLAQANAADLYDDTKLYVKDDLASGLTITGSSAVAGLTIEGYGFSGTDYPMIGDGTAAPINIAVANVASDLVLRYLKWGNQEWQNPKASMATITGVTGITIEDCLIAGFEDDGEPSADQVGKNGLFLSTCGGAINLTRIEVKNLGPVGLPKAGEDIVGIYGSGFASGTALTITGCTGHNIQADVIQIVGSAGMTLVIDGLIAYDYGENGIDLKGVDNYEIKNCDFPAGSFCGGGGTSPSYGQAIVLHGKADPSGRNSTTGRVHDNTFTGIDSAIGIGTSVYRISDIWLYNNVYTDVGRETDDTERIVISFSSNWDNVRIFNEKVFNINRRAAAFISTNSATSGGLSIEHCTVDGFYTTILDYAWLPGQHVQNNIFVNRASGATDYLLNGRSNATSPALSNYNIWWMPNKLTSGVWINWYNAVGTQVQYAYADAAAWVSAYPGHTGDVFANPLLLGTTGRASMGGPGRGAATTTPPTLNPIANSRFELWQNSTTLNKGWNNASLTPDTAVNRTTTKRSGTYAFRWNVDASANAGSVGQTIYLLPEQVYTLSYYQYKTAAVAIQAAWSLVASIGGTTYYYNATSNAWETSDPGYNSAAISATTTWELVTESITTPAGINAATFTLSFAGAGAASNYVYIDDLSLILVNGTSWARTVDAAGRSMKGTAWDIGAMEALPSSGGMGMGIGIGLH